MKTLFSFLLICGWCGTALLAQEPVMVQADTTVQVAPAVEKVRFVGTLADSANQLPVEGVAVAWLKDSSIKAHAVTDENGTFVFDNLEPGLQEFQTYHLGYNDGNFSATLQPGLNRDSIQLAPSAFSLNSVEVMGIRPADYSRLPGTGTKLTPKTLQRFAPTGTQEALEYVPGVTGFSDDGMGNSRINIGIRGLNPRRSSRTLVLEDGIPIQPALYVYSNMYYNPPVERINEIEVIKGSASIEYGPQTMGGVINYITNRPRKDFGGRLSLVGGNNGYGSTMVEVGGWGNDKIRPEIQLLYKTGNGYRDNNHFEQLNGTFKLLLVPNKKRRIYINMNANYEDSDATYTGLTEYSYENDRRFNPKQFDQFIVQRYAMNVLQQHKINANWEGSSKLYINYFDRDWWRELDIFVRESDFLNGDLIEVPSSESGDVEDLIRVGNGSSNFGIQREFIVGGIEQQYLWDHRLGNEANGKMHIGGRFHFERFIDNAGNGNAPDARSSVLYRANNYETYAAALFLREDITIDQFTLSPGIRLEAFEQELVNRLNNNALDDATTVVILPGLGFNYQMKEYAFFGGFHRGMTPPSNGTLLTLNFGETGGTDFEAVDLKAETSWNSEIGVRTNQKYFSAEIAGFHLSIENMIAAARSTAFTNLDRVTSTGAEGAATVKLSAIHPLLPNLFANYTYLETKVHNGVLANSALGDDVVPDVSGNELPYAPNHNLIAGLIFSFRNKVEVMANYRYQSKSWSDYENINFRFNRGDTGPIPAFWLFNASVNYRVNANFRTFASVKNILDKKYIGSRLHSHPSRPFAAASSGIIPGPSRQINVGINYSF
ncbi:MAG: TonB-dependent receptor domain-containing protein [Salibacteraceae bacterium]